MVNIYRQGRYIGPYLAFFFLITGISQLLFVWPVSVVSGTFILTALRT